MSSISNLPPRKLRVGLIGAGDVAQVVHLPTLALLSDYFTINAISDISPSTAAHCAHKYHIPHHTAHAHHLISDPDLDVIFVLTSDASHEHYCIAALEAGKHVFVEKPLSLSVQSAERILAATADPKAGKLFVGYMRRYAPSFVQAFKREVFGEEGQETGSANGKILYARVRDIIGPNAHYISQSGTEVRKWDGDWEVGVREQEEERLEKLRGEAFGGWSSGEKELKFWRILGGLGSHDLSLMREILGSPTSISGVTLNPPFYTALLNFTDPLTKHTFSCTYETGTTALPGFDASLTIYTNHKTISIIYDTPFVKGLPIKVRVQELNSAGEMQVREILSSYEDAYTAELRELWAAIVEGKPVKTGAEDAVRDLKVNQSILQAWGRQKEDVARWERELGGDAAV